jgi:hypothetical protein
MKLRAFLFDSAYQILTWVFIALSIGAIFFFLSKQDYRGVLWSVVALLICILIMLGLLADRYITEWKAVNVPSPPTDRPWLNIEAIPAGPITYLPQQAGICAFFPIKFRVTNTGHSPSSDIQLKASVFFARFQEDPRERQRKIAAWKGHPFNPGVVFPDTPEEYKMTWVKPISEMKEAGINPGTPTSEQVKHFDAYVGGCISYTYGEGFYGETGFLYEVNVHPADRPDTNIVPEIEKEIPLERLTFRRYFFGGSEWAK